MGQERFMLVQPLAGNLKKLLDKSGEGMIYRHCYSTADIEKAYDELIAAGVQPEDENGKPLALREQLADPTTQSEPFNIGRAAPQALGVVTRAGDVKHLAQPINRLMGTQLVNQRERS